jgi:hypothetical protein
VEPETIAMLAAFALMATFVLVLVWAQSRRYGGASPAPPPEVPPDVADLVRRLADPDTADAARDDLVGRGSAVVPDLVAATATSDDPSPIVDVLAQIGDERAFRALENMGATGALASFGTAEVLPVLLETLRKIDPPVMVGGWIPARCEVYAGIAQARTWGRVTPAFREGLVVAVARRVGEARWRPGTSAARALIALDPDAAVAVLTSPDVLGRGPGAVGEAFEALLEAGVVVDPSLAASAAEELPVAPVQYSFQEDVLSAVLTMLARSGHASAYERIQRYARIPDEATHRIAIDALGALHGVHDVARCVEQRRLAGTLLPEHRTWLRVRRYLDAAAHDLWFESDEGDRLAETQDALREIGADDAAAILAEACDAFVGGVPPDRAARAARTGLAAERGDMPFAAQDERLRTITSSVEDRLADYVIAHADAFRDAAAGAEPL